MVNKGFNKILYEARLKKNLSLKDAAKLLHLNKTYLRLIESGYITISPKLEVKFLEFYKLDKNFIKDDLCYPVMLEEEQTKIVGSFWHKLFNAAWFKLGCFLLALTFLAMGATGGVMNYYSEVNTSKFFDQSTVVALRDYSRDNPDQIIELSDATTIEGINDRVYVLDNSCYYPSGYGKDDAIIRLLTPGKEKNIVYSTISGQFNFKATLPSDIDRDIVKALKEIIVDFVEGLPIDITTTFSIRYAFGSTRIKMNLCPLGVATSIGSATAVAKGDILDLNYEFKDLSFLGPVSMLVSLEEDSVLYKFLTGVFNERYSLLIPQLDSFMASDHVPYVSGLSEYSTNFANGSFNFGMFVVDSMALLLAGIIFFCLFLALSALFLFKVRPVEVEENKEEHKLLKLSNKDDLTRDSAQLKRNWKIFPIFPGNLLKFISISMIFVYSIGFYFLFNSITNLNIAQATNIINFENWLSPILIIAFLLLFFVKLDIVQEKKNYFLTNYFWFFSGLALYMLYVFIGRTALLDNTATSNIGKLLLDVLPGNFLWGFLAFNMMVLLLFYHPISVGNDKKKLFKYRLLSIIPISYLVVSLILELGASYGGWVIPFTISSLFFTKAVDLLVFALLFTIIVFIYKHWTVKKYGEEKAILYQHGNKYYFVKNAIAAAIVLCIGIFEIAFHFAWPNNPIGMGQDYLILCSVPFILLYHPHHGKRSEKWDNIFLIYYDTAYAIGIVLIALSVIISIVSA